MMKKITEQIEYLEFDSVDELDDNRRNLLALAKEALSNSYAPYSKYHVGAAVELADGTVVPGANQENVSFPAGLCAERVAFFAAGAQHPNTPVIRVAITAKTDKFPIPHPVAPCGSCRQSMLETEHKFGRNIEVILQGMEGVIWVIPSIKSLLPVHFEEDRLKK